MINCPFKFLRDKMNYYWGEFKTPSEAHWEFCIMKFLSQTQMQISHVGGIE